MCVCLRSGRGSGAGSEKSNNGSKIWGGGTPGAKLAEASGPELMRKLGQRRHPSNPWLKGTLRGVVTSKDTTKRLLPLTRPGVGTTRSRPLTPKSTEPGDQALVTPVLSLSVFVSSFIHSASIS